MHKLFSLLLCSSLFDMSHNYADETPYRSQYVVANCPAESTFFHFFNDSVKNKCGWDTSLSALNRSAAIKHGLPYTEWKVVPALVLRLVLH